MKRQERAPWGGLVKVTNLSGTGIIAEFSYDVLGRRYEKKTQTEITKYVYSNENVLSEYKTSNGITLKKEYINGLGTDDLIAVEQEENSLTISEREELSFCETSVLTNTGGFVKYGWNAIVDRCESLSQSGSNIVTNRYYFSKDNLGSVVGITDNSGSLVASYEYDSYGNFTLSGSDIGNDRLYTGREYDEEIGLYYLRARYYDSSLGRFISRDPIDIQDNVNLYSYVGNNPINYTDSSGLLAKEILGDAYDVLSNIDWDKAQYNVGEGLVVIGGGVAVATAPACASSVSVTTTCVGVTGGFSLATGGAGIPSMSVCIPSGVTAGASCLATAGGGAVAGVGNYMMNSSNGKETGSYTIKFKSGKEYHGKGPKSRANESAKRESKNNNDEVDSIDWKKAEDDKDAFIQEALRIKNAGGLGPKIYNRINSPGNKLLP